MYLIIFKKFSRTTGSISTKLSTNHTRVNGILVSSHKGPCPFLRGDNSHIIYIEKKKLLQILKPLLTKLGTNYYIQIINNSPSFQIGGAQNIPYLNSVVLKIPVGTYSAVIYQLLNDTVVKIWSTLSTQQEPCLHSAQFLQKGK